MTFSTRQNLFAQEYLIDFNATQAAIRAGYSTTSAYSIGSENLRKPEIQYRIQREIADRSKRTEIRADDVLRELARIALTHTPPYLYRETRNTWEIYAYPMKSKLKAIELIGRHLGMYKGRGCTCLPDPRVDFDEYIRKLPQPKKKSTLANARLREVWSQIMASHSNET